MFATTAIERVSDYLIYAKTTGISGVGSQGWSEATGSKKRKREAAGCDARRIQVEMTYLPRRCYGDAMMKKALLVVPMALV